MMIHMGVRGGGQSGHPPPQIEFQYFYEQQRIRLSPVYCEPINGNKLIYVPKHSTSPGKSADTHDT